MKDLAGLLQERDRNQGISTVVHNNDDKYVPIEKSQSAVIKAIEDLDGPPMIVLHGGVGKGKSTLARYVCQLYGQVGDRKGIFDHVIVVSCGNTSISDLATKQYEILELHSLTSVTERNVSKPWEPWENISAKFRIAKAFQNFFMDNKIFMVLDDVSDKRFLYKMWEAARSGKDNKILITSQLSNLCDDIKRDSVLIRMEDPTKEEARQILSSLVGLESNVLPDDIKEIADEMIRATARNPLALACLASNFAFAKCAKDKTRKRDWQAALTELAEILDNEATAIVLGQNIEIAPRSLWGAMKICIDSLKAKHARRLLFLIYACKGESIPEEVLRILCAGMKMSNSAFQKAKDELCMRELLKPTADTLTSKVHLDEDPNDEECSAWSLLTLVRLYLQQDVFGKQEMRGVIGSLIGNDELSRESSTKSSRIFTRICTKFHLSFTRIFTRVKAQECEADIEEIETKRETDITESETRKVTIVLCALYFDRQHNDQAVTRAVTKASQISNLEDSPISDLRRKAIEPLIWLLDKPEEDEEWTEIDKCYVRKVLLDYICRRQLDSEHISYLLKLAACPSSQLATLKAITRITSIEEKPLFNVNTIRFVTVPLDIMSMEEEFPTSFQEAASAALSGICWKAAFDKSATLVTNMSGVLDVLVNSLAIPVWKSDTFAQNAAIAIAGLAYTRDRDNHEIVVSRQGLLPNLVSCTLQQCKPSLQVAATGALANLSTFESVQLRIVNEKGALAGLVNCLSKHDNGELQTQGARALANLAASTNESLKLRIANEKGALVGLMNCFSKHFSSDLQKQAARALAYLAIFTNEVLGLRTSGEEVVMEASSRRISMSHYEIEDISTSRSVHPKLFDF